MLTTETVLAGTSTCYQGPCTDRISLRDAAERGILRFVVNRGHVYTPLGEQNVFGSFKTVEEAAECAKLHRSIPGIRISATAAPYGYLEECFIWCSWHKPYGDLD